MKIHLFQCITSLLMLCSVNIFSLINYFSFANWLWVGVAVCGMLYLRYTRPDSPRPIFIPTIIPVLFLGCCIFLVVVPLYAKPFETGIGLLIILSGLPVYLLTKKVKWKSKTASNINGESASFLCHLTLILTSLHLFCLWCSGNSLHAAGSIDRPIFGANVAVSLDFLSLFCHTSIFIAPLPFGP